MNDGLRAFVEQIQECFEAGDAAVLSKAPEQRNVDCLRAFYAAVAGGDFDAAHALLTEDPEYVVFASGPTPFQMRGRGRGEVQTGIRNNFGSVSFDAVEIDTFVAQGDLIVVIARQRGRWLASQVAFDERIVLEYAFRDGRIRRYRGWILPGAP